MTGSSFQDFSVRSNPGDGPPRLAALRKRLADADLQGFLVPRADAHQGEYVASCDERLAWLTGFTGSAGHAAVLKKEAAIFIDGRYKLQVGDQVSLDHFSPVDWPKTKVSDWLADRVMSGDRVGFDPWLHTTKEVEQIRKALSSCGAELVATSNQIDAIWTDRPPAPSALAFAYPDDLAGKSSGKKRGEIAKELGDSGQSVAVLTLPDSIAWLLNIRGDDIPRIPIVQAFAILDSGGAVRLFTDPTKFSELKFEGVEIFDWDDFEKHLAGLIGPVRLDRATAPFAVGEILKSNQIEIDWQDDPCILAKAQKSPTELNGARSAHQRDAIAMTEFLAWIDETAPSENLTEIDVVQNLEAFRRQSNALRDIAFETIAGTGANAAIVHYRVTEDTNRPLRSGELLLVDSGGQYLDGTTDITRTIAIGAARADQKRAFTLVLKGMIAISMARWPSGIAGRDLDALARVPLWRAGMDYDHGTGHGVGAYLSVHEGPQRLSRISHVPLLPGMILSNEPGYYRAGDFGIRIENLVAVEEAPELPGADDRDMLQFETLTFVPIDRSLVDVTLLTPDEVEWLNTYHASVAEKLFDHLSSRAQGYLKRATAPI